eukprot:TRINITY_DN10255_c0_g2_i2.p1 TRINITY_DN10255_c0_g2~~TRINITY_DN10255_c0_g2_i2.p1  ORF type:complete len:750 (+),score=188.83 TRINITY_DN10255_c0_g2_i2:108-2357(+)
MGRRSVALQALETEGVVAAEKHASMLMEQVNEVQEEEAEALEAARSEERRRPLIALVSHDNMKPLMATFAKTFQEWLKEFRLTGTGTTCGILRAVGLSPEEWPIPSGPLGGDQVLGGMMANGDIKGLFFFRDPLSSHAHIADIEALSRLADVYQIYFCTNYRTSAAVLENLHKKLMASQKVKHNANGGGGGGLRSSICVPSELADLGQAVQENYKKTRQAAIAAATGQCSETPGNRSEETPVAAAAAAAAAAGQCSETRGKEEDWNSARRLSQAERPDVSKALCPSCRYPLRLVAAGSTEGKRGSKTCQRSKKEVELKDTHFECEACAAVVSLEKGPVVYIDQHYDTYDSNRHELRLNEMNLGSDGEIHVHDPERRLSRIGGVQRKSIVVAEGEDLLGADRAGSMEDMQLTANTGQKVARDFLKKVLEVGALVREEECDVMDQDWAGVNQLPKLTQKQVLQLCSKAKSILEAQPSVVEAQVPCTVFGDIHGQLRDVLLLFNQYGWPGAADDRQFVFNGDFVDRGAHQVEVLLMLLSLKVCFPDRIWLVRGNHEDVVANKAYGFEKACVDYFEDGPTLFSVFQICFDLLPFACLIDKKVLVVHGGIGDGDWTVDKLGGYQRPIHSDAIYQDGLLFNVLWSDPIEDDDRSEAKVIGVHPSTRGGLATKFGWNVTTEFCAKNNIHMIIRSHQAKQGGLGFDAMHEMMLMRVFSARDYDDHDNDAAVLLFTKLEDDNLIVRPQSIRAKAKATE